MLKYKAAKRLRKLEKQIEKARQNKVRTGCIRHTVCTAV